jgi:hypothetical protein
MHLHHSRGAASSSLFAVKHYAGTVEYSAEGLTEANGDPALRGYTPQEVRDLLASSTRGDILQVDEVTNHLQLVSQFAIIVELLLLQLLLLQLLLQLMCMRDCSAARH